MPGLPVTASSPIAFTSKDGNFFLVPLSALYIDSNGVAQADQWPLFPTYKSILTPLLADLQSGGILAAGPAPAHKPAFITTAKTPGASGIDIEITIANVAPNAGAPASSKADVTVTETDTYTGLAADKVIDTIGSAANGGTRPGLVFVSSPGPTALPAAGEYAMAGDPATADIPKDGGGGTAFTLHTRDGGPDAALVHITIKDVDAAHHTFTLVVKWAKPAIAIAMSDLAAAFAFVVTITAPTGGYLAPGAGTTQLSGGSDAISVSPVKSSAVVLSNA